MKKITLVTLIILVTILLAFASGQGTSNKSPVPKNARWVIHFDMNLFTQSHLYNRLLDEEGLTRLKKRNAKIAEKYGVDMLKDLESLTLFNAGQDDEDAVVCVRGKIDTAHLLGLLDKEDSHKEIPYGDFVIHQWDDDEHGVFAGDRMVMVSANLEGLKEALDVFSGRAAGASGTWEDFDSLAGKTFLMAAVRDLSEIIDDHDGPVILRNLEKAHFYLNEDRDNLALQASLATGSDEEAKKLEDVVRGLLALASLQADSGKHKIKIPEDVSIERSGKTLEVRLVYPVEEMLSMLSLGLGLRTADFFELDFF